MEYFISIQYQATKTMNNTTFFNNCVRLRLKYGLTFRVIDIIIKQIKEEIT
jgi:hypothetical protein